MARALISCFRAVLGAAESRRVRRLPCSSSMIRQSAGTNFLDSQVDLEADMPGSFFQTAAEIELLERQSLTSNGKTPSGPPQNPSKSLREGPSCSANAEVETVDLREGQVTFASLVLHYAEDEEELVELSVEADTTIGRTRDSTVWIDNKLVSNRHCRFHTVHEYGSRSVCTLRAKSLDLHQPATRSTVLCHRPVVQRHVFPSVFKYVYGLA